MHNTKSENIPSIKKEWLRSYKSRWLDKHWEDDPAAIWWTLQKNHIGYWWNQVYFRIKKSEAEKLFVNRSVWQIMVYHDIPPEDIVAINPAIDWKVWRTLWKYNKADLIDYFDEWVKEFGYDYVKNRFVNEYWFWDAWDIYEKSIKK